MIRKAGCVDQKIIIVTTLITQKYCRNKADITIHEEKIMATNRGTVKWFNSSKGFGFIEPQGGGSDVFAHYSEIDMDGYKTLDEGQQVEYELQDGDKGPKATGIREAS